MQNGGWSETRYHCDEPKTELMTRWRGSVAKVNTKLLLASKGVMPMCVCYVYVREPLPGAIHVIELTLCSVAGTGTYWHKPNVTHLLQPFMPDRLGRIETRKNTSLGDILGANKTAAADRYTYQTKQTGRG